MPSRRHRVCPGCVHGSPPVFPECSADPLWGLNRRLLCGAVWVVRSLIAAFSDAWAPWQFGRVVLRLPGSDAWHRSRNSHPSPVFFLSRRVAPPCDADRLVSPPVPAHRFVVAMCAPVR